MTDHTGQQLGNYRLLRLLGRGGFAEVYLGEHIYLKTQAAIKLLQTQLIASRAIEDFLKEGQTIARLAHTHIVRVLDFGVEQNMPFLVMEYAPHGTLRQRHADRTPLPVSLVISYVSQIATALQYAHDQHLIHRDIKPENMLVGATGNVLLSDFGISTVVHTSHSLSTQDISGTVSYMAPEQLQGKASPASDQYALAVVVYEWLTGKCPFRGTFAEVASKHLFASPQPLRERVPNIHPEVEEAVMVGLAKTPEQRFARVEAFARALETASFGGTATFFSPRSPQSSQPPPHTSRVLASSSPDLPVPLQATPIPGSIVTPWSATLRATPIPGSIPGPLPVRQGPSRRTVLWRIAGVVAVAAAAGAGISTLLFSQMHPQIGTKSQQATFGPAGVTPTAKIATIGQTLNIYTGNHFSVGCAAWSPNALRVASSALNVQVWDALTGGNVLNYSGHTSRAQSADWSPDGHSIVSGGDDQTVQVWNASTGHTNFLLTGHADVVWAVAWSPDGTYLASGSGDNRVGVWDAAQGRNLFFYQGHSHTVYAVSFAADSQRIASASYDTTVQVWHTTNGSSLFTYTGHSHPVLAVAWAPASANTPSYIASGSSDMTVQVWDMNNGGNLIRKYTQHTAGVTSLAWSPNGRYIASGDRQAQVRVWEAATGQTLFVYTKHTDVINWVAWSPNGQQIASASHDQTVQVWQAPQ